MYKIKQTQIDTLNDEINIYNNDKLIKTFTTRFDYTGTFFDLLIGLSKNEVIDALENCIIEIQLNDGTELQGYFKVEIENNYIIVDDLYILIFDNDKFVKYEDFEYGDSIFDTYNSIDMQDEDMVNRLISRGSKNMKKRLVSETIRDTEEYMFDTELTDADETYIEFKEYFNKNNKNPEFDVDELWEEYNERGFGYPWRQFLDYKFGEYDYCYDDYYVTEEDIHYLQEIKQQLNEFYANNNMDEFWDLWSHYSDVYKDNYNFRPSVRDMFPDL